MTFKLLSARGRGIGKQSNFDIFHNFSFLQHCSSPGQAYFNHDECNEWNVQNLFPSMTRIDWCMCNLNHIILSKKSLKKIISKKVFLFVQNQNVHKNINQSDHFLEDMFHICTWPIRSGFANAGKSFWPIRFGFMSVFVVKPCDTPYFRYCEQQYYWFCHMVVMTLYCICYQQ